MRDQAESFGRNILKNEPLASLLRGDAGEVLRFEPRNMDDLSLFLNSFNEDRKFWVGLGVICWCVIKDMMAWLYQQLNF